MLSGMFIWNLNLMDREKQGEYLFDYGMCKFT